MKVGDLVKVGGSTNTVSWYGEMGIIVHLEAERWHTEYPNYSWYRVALVSGRIRTVRNDALKVINESR